MGPIHGYAVAQMRLWPFSRDEGRNAKKRKVSQEITFLNSFCCVGDEFSRFWG
jgi:hypothetical protein